jgi:hypothetical protein
MAAEIARFTGLVAYAGMNWEGSVKSWGRTRAHNTSLKGSHPQSLHLWWLACDMTFDTVSGCLAAFDWLCQRGMGGYVRNGNRSFHIQNWPKGQGPRPISEG